MGWGDLGSYGAANIPTPAMDRVAAEGIRATDCHSASAVCSPSRYAVLTGRYAWRSPLKRGVLLGESPPIIERDRPTLASVLKAAGYATGAFGKWHLGLGWCFKDRRRWNAFEAGSPLRAEVEDGSIVDYSERFSDGPTERGFDRFFGITGSLDMQPYCFLDQDRTVGIPSVPKCTFGPQQMPGLQVEGWRDDEVDVRFMEEACRWIRSQARGDRPFFCYLPLSAPHRPCVPPEFARGRSEAGPRGDMVCVVDWAVGQLLDLLDELGLADNTLLIITSDNGALLTDVDGQTYGHRPNGSWRGQKSDIWEGGHREPFLARWPAHIPRGTVTSALFGLIDLMPTIAAATDSPMPPDAAEDAVDILPVLTDEEQSSPRNLLVHHSGSGVFSVRLDNWKLVMGSGSGGNSEPKGRPCNAWSCNGQLYDLSQDPAETRNLWSNYPAVVDRLYSALKVIALGPTSGLSFDALAGLSNRVPSGAWWWDRPDEFYGEAKRA
jgi:arylsulfatase A